MREPRNGVFSNSDVDSLETVVEILVRGNEKLNVSFLVGVANLSAFDVYFKDSSGGSYYEVVSATADFTVTDGSLPAGPMYGCSGDLTLAAFGSTVHWLKLKVEGVHTVRIRAAGTSSTVAGTFGAF